MKKFVKVISSSLVSIMLFSACNTSGGTSREVSGELTLPDETQNVQLKVSWWGSDTRHQAILEVARLYMEKNPNVTIVSDYGAFDGWQTKLLTQLSGGTEPDVMQVNYNWVHSFGRGENVFYNLNDLSDFIDLSNWDQEQLDAMTVGGELGAVPHGVTARAVLYNKTLFEENNIEYPYTYNDVIAAGAIIGRDNTDTGSQNQYVLTNIGPVSTDLFIAQMLYNKTGKIMQENGVVSYTPEEVAEIFDIYRAMEEANALPKFRQEDPIQNESNPVWTGGRSGSVYEWVGTMDKYLETFKGGGHEDEIAVAPYIVENAGDEVSVFVKPSLGYSISKNSSNPAVAADFINFMFTDEEAIKALGTSLGVSSNKVSREVQDREGFITGAMKEGYDLLDQYDQVVMDPYFEDENIRGVRYIAIEALRTGADSLATATDYVQRQQMELDRLLSQ